MGRFSIKTFILGLIIGVLLAVILKSLKQNNSKRIFLGPEKPFSISYKKQAKIIPYIKKIPFDTLRYGSKKYIVESHRLKTKVNILCLIIVKSPKNLQAARDTWAKGCNRLETLDLTKKKLKLPKIGKNRQQTSWNKLCEALKLINKQDWLFIVNDSAFVLLENLRFFLNGLDPYEEYYLGHPIQFWSTIYMTAQAGIVLSWGSLRALRFLPCDTEYVYNNMEDYYLGKMLHSIHIEPMDSTDLDGLSIFNPSNLHNALVAHKENFFKTHKHTCCSSFLTSFHAIDGDKMYTYYYLLYTLQLFYEGNNGNKHLKSPPDYEIWGGFLKSRNLPSNISSEQYYKTWEEIVHDPAEFMRHLREENNNNLE